MKVEHKDLLERQSALEEKIADLEQQLEMSMQAVESILVHMGDMNGAITVLVEAASQAEESQHISIVTPPHPDWEPIAQLRPKNVTPKDDV